MNICEHICAINFIHNPPMIRSNHKNHLHTTLSNKHFELLKKYKEKFGTHQKALEFALENLENAPQNISLTIDEQFWLRICRELKKNICIVHKDIFEGLIESVDFAKNKEIACDFKMLEYLIVWYLQKPLKKCSLKDILDSVVIILKNMNCLLDTVSYTDDGGHYELKITHTVSMQFSMLFNVFFEELFKSYGVKTDSELSENSIFVRIYENSSPR